MLSLHSDHQRPRGQDWLFVLDDGGHELQSCRLWNLLSNMLNNPRDSFSVPWWYKHFHCGFPTQSNTESSSVWDPFFWHEMVKFREHFFWDFCWQLRSKTTSIYFQKKRFHPFRLHDILTVVTHNHKVVVWTHGKATPGSQSSGTFTFSYMILKHSTVEAPSNVNLRRQEELESKWKQRFSRVQ